MKFLSQILILCLLTQPASATVGGPKKIDAGIIRNGSATLTLPTSTSSIPGITPTNHGVLVSGSGAVASVTGVGTSGQVLTSNGASADPTFQNAAAANDPGQLSNLGLSVTRTDTNTTLTIALKQSDGSTDPASGAGAVKVAMRSGTATSGAYSVRSVTSALSLKLTQGTTLGMQANQAQNVYVYLIDSDGAGTMKLGVSTLLRPDTELQSTIAESFSATATSASPAVFTATGNGLSNQSAVQMTGTPPTGFSTGTKYWVVANGTDGTGKFRLSAGIAGTAVNSSSTGSSIVMHVADSSLVSDAVYSNVAARLIGYFTISEATPGTYATAPTVVSVNQLRIPRQQKISVFGTSATTTVSTSNTTIVQPTIVNNDLGNYSTGTFICPAAGKLTMDVAYEAGGVTSSAANHGQSVVFFKNGVSIAVDAVFVWQVGGVVVAPIAHGQVADYPCAAGDYFEMDVSRESSVSSNTFDGSTANHATFTWTPIL